MKKLLLVLFISQFYLLTSVCASPNLAPVYSLLLDGSDVDENADWKGVNKVVGQDPFSYDYFGKSVAIHGDYAVIGAYDENCCLGDYTSFKSGIGAVYLYKHNHTTKKWELLERITENSKNSDFGYSVAINEDTIVIGARSEDLTEDDNEFSHGAVYIYENYKQGIGAPIKLTQTIPASFFGSSVAISNNKIVVGSTFGHNSLGGEATDSDRNFGAAYIYTKGDSWNLEHTIVSNEPDKLFGYDVSIHDDYIVVGSDAGDTDGASLAYYYNNGSWSSNGSFPSPGHDIVLVSNSFLFATIYRGAHSFNGMTTGYVNIYKRNTSDTNWEFLQKIEPTEPSSTHGFGADISISDDEKTLAISDRGETIVYLYSQTPTGWTLDSNVTQLDKWPRSLSFGNSIAVTNTSLVVGANSENYDVNESTTYRSAGAAYFFGK